MRKAFEHYLQQQWYGGARLNIGLFLLSGLYKSLHFCHRCLYRFGVFKTRKLSQPVIVVGNFTAGGTGKTPFVIALVKALQAQGWKPGVVSRGYGRESSMPVTVSQDSLASNVGDEPLLIYRHTQVAVRVDANRVSASEILIAEGCNVIIADDGLQHFRLHRDIEIEILDSQRRYGNGLMIPAGPLRETPRQCDFQVLSGNGDANYSDANQFLMSFQLGDAYALGDNSKCRTLNTFNEENIIAIAGIGNPSRFFSALKKAGVIFSAQAMPDHYQFSNADFQSGSLYLMTEKDAVKCQALNIENAWVVPLQVSVDNHLFQHIDAKLRAKL